MVFEFSLYNLLSFVIKQVLFRRNYVRFIWTNQFDQLCPVELKSKKLFLFLNKQITRLSVALH